MTNSEKKQAEKLEALKQKKRRSNSTDFILFVILVVIAINNQAVASQVWYAILLCYVLVILPLLVMTIGTPGQLMAGILVRKKTDKSRRVTFIDALSRILSSILSGLTGFFKKDEKDNFSLRDSQLIDKEAEFSDEEIAAHNKQRAWFNFSLVALIYLAWVIWLGNYWFLLGLPIIFDIYVSNRVNWTPWKKREGENHWLVEWLDALIFAIVAVTLINIFLFQNYKIPTGSMEKSLLVGDHLYVSKIAYGPRIPHTPLSIPFMPSTIPGTNAKSYVEWIQLPYKRLAGFGPVERNDAVVFNFPAGDSVLNDVEMQQAAFYHHIRDRAENKKMEYRYARIDTLPDQYYYNLARQDLLKDYELYARPVDRRDNYIKRCVAIHGDTLVIEKGKVFVNGEPQIEIPGVQYMYLVQTKQRFLNEKKLENLGINKEYYKKNNYGRDWTLQLPLTDEMAEELQRNPQVASIKRLIRQPDFHNYQIFPHDSRYPWNLDNFGPLYIPEAGATVELSLENLPLYRRIIDVYEENDLEVRDSTIYINGEQANQYTFKMNYYWMMGDNRHSSLDSRYWGFVPEDHIVGKPKFIWLSLNKDKSFPFNIRVKRMFMRID